MRRSPVAKEGTGRRASNAGGKAALKKASPAKTNRSRPAETKTAARKTAEGATVASKTAPLTAPAAPAPPPERRGPGRPKVPELPAPVTGLTRRQQAILDVI